MASSLAPKIQTMLADAAIAKGKVVKFGTDFKHVAVSAADTDHHIGIAQSVTTAAEDPIEVAMPGGGAKGLISESVNAGDFLCSADGTLIVADDAADIVIAQAKQDGVANDLIDVEIMIFPASGANA